MKKLIFLNRISSFTKSIHAENPQNLKGPRNFKNHKNPGNPEKERGSIVVLVALGLTVLLGFGTLVTDIGLLYVEKAKLQNAVDAAALAGVQELPSNPSRARLIAQDYANQNGTPTISVHFEANNSKITVTAEKKVPTVLARIWGITEGEVSAKASAMMVPPTSLSGAMPFSIEKQDFVYGVTYTLKSGSDKDEDNAGVRYPGWFGALRLGGSGASNYEDNIKYGYKGTLSIGDILEIENGNMSGPTEKGINNRLAQDTRIPKNTFDNYDRNAPQIVYVPIVEIIDRDGDSVHQVKIVGFAAFFLEGVAGNGNESIVTGRFIKTLVPNEQSNDRLSDLLAQEEKMETGTSEADFGLYTPKLVDR